MNTRNRRAPSSVVRKPWPASPRAVIRLESGRKSFVWRSSVSRVVRVLAAAALAVLSPLGAEAAFQTPLATPQSMAMGGVMLASEEDTAGLFQTAAAPAGLKRGEAFFLYHQLYAGLEGAAAMNQALVTAGLPTRLGTFAVGFANFKASGLLEERVLGLTWSRRWFDRLDLGVTGKYMGRDHLVGSDPLAAADPVFANGTKKSVVSLDAGLTAKVTSALRAGVAVRNLNSPDVGLASEDRVPREIQAGASYMIEPWRLRVAADATMRDNKVGTLRDRTILAAGVEKSLAEDRVRFRLGGNTEQFAAGVGLRLERLHFDYAFILARSLAADNAGSHQIGVKVLFGGAK